MPDRTLNWGDPSDAGTKYRTQDDDPAGGGNFVVAEDTDNNTVLLQYNPTASQWEYAGPVDMGSNDISNAGTISANALEAVGEVSIKANRQNDSTGHSAGDNINLVDNERTTSTGDLDGNFEFSPSETGDFVISALGRVNPANDQDQIAVELRLSDGSFVEIIAEDRASGTTNPVSLSGSLNITLDSSNTYQVIASDKDGAFDVLADSRFELYKSLNDPN